MKLFAKTLGWAAISGTIFFAAALLQGCTVSAAAWAAFWATAGKTWAYPIWEKVFARLYPV